MVDKFSKFFEDSFFIQIGTSALGICASIFSMVFVSELLPFSQFNLKFYESWFFIQNFSDDVIIQAYYYVVIIYFLFDTFIVMLLGNKIMESSDRLSYCLFESDWISQSPKCKKCIVIMAEVLKKSQEIIICKLYPLNLQTFTSVSYTLQKWHGGGIFYFNW